MFSGNEEKKKGSMLDKKSRRNLRPQPTNRILVDFINIHDNAARSKVFHPSVFAVSP